MPARRRGERVARILVVALLIALLLPSAPRGKLRSELALLVDRLAQSGPAVGQDSLALRLLASEARCSDLLRQVKAMQREQKAWLSFRAGFPEESFPRACSARILRHSDSSSSFRLGRLQLGPGSRVREGDLVLASGALLGRIVRATEGRAEALWIEDPSFRILIRVASKPTETTAVLSGRLCGKPVLQLLSGTDPRPGDPVYTAPEGSWCSASIPIGRVAEIEAVPTEPMPRVTVELAVRPESVQIVQVVAPNPLFAELASTETTSERRE